MHPAGVLVAFRVHKINRMHTQKSHSVDELGAKNGQKSAALEHGREDQRVLDVMLDHNEDTNHGETSYQSADDLAVAPREGVSSPGKAKNQGSGATRQEECTQVVVLDDLARQGGLLCSGELQDEDDNSEAHGANDQVDPEAPSPGRVSAEPC